MKINNLNNYTYSFDAKKEKEKIVKWIQDWFEVNGKDCNAVVGISGGKDSSVVATLCVEALGKDRVYGVLMPNGNQSDIEDAISLIEFLDSKTLLINIEKIIKALKSSTSVTLSKQAEINLPPRVRMTTLYAISQSVNGRVANTSNLSESLIGFETRWGDSVGDFSPLANYTATEVVAIGKELGIPTELIEKTPADGLTGKTDEDNLGFTYKTLDTFIRTGECNEEDKRRILNLYKKNRFKQYMPEKCDNDLPVCI